MRNGSLITLALAGLALALTACDPPPGIVRMRRDSDNKQALCFIGADNSGRNSLGNNASISVVRCVAACEKLGFVIEKSFPSDLIVNTDGVGDVPEDRCSIMLRKMW
ncbi:MULTISPECIES: hypothetical protein [unclassified Mesorhizobium]|uniref:hypothetical protein n=1 Tax=unclassified Mesorhizobium TaxID=325217 RepID=UPI001092F835|nr:MULTISPECIES: hypothetical protein [unclassified Mesorhizobium]TGQ01796.1 hypothetical protein EN861_03550 [Mesorhizobium sp. M8A.F.Ca.ET.218.01.1.1]TGT21069.1 hypothetical protein EN856_03555 [Mesorhizobium sp. M8A.F.Ca.ET.213.01.1.1]